MATCENNRTVASDVKLCPTRWVVASSGGDSNTAPALLQLENTWTLLPLSSSPDRWYLPLHCVTWNNVTLKSHL